MKPNDDLTALINFIYRTRLKVPINQDHKDRLRRQLFHSPKPISLFWRRLVLAASFLIIVGSAVYYCTQSDRPIVGIALWHFNTTRTTNIRMGEWNETGRDAMTVFLCDQTELHLQPFTKFCVVSTSSDRSEEDAIIYLKRGVLDACVPKKLAYALIVRTPDANVRVTGTKFRVEVTAAPH